MVLIAQHGDPVSVQIGAPGECKHLAVGRDVKGVDDNPFNFETVKKNIESELNPEFEGRFKIMLVPNITNISYGRGVGYKIEEVVLPEEIQKISATKIRAKMREEGKLE